MLEMFKKSNGNGKGEVAKELLWMKDQPKTTYFGYEITPIKTGLPKTVDSLCPDCKKIIPAVLYEEDGKVWMTKECPEHCGLCNMHTSVSSLPIIDLTNMCNLTCPVCFANANAAGYLYEPTYDEVVRMLETLLTQKPVASDRVQFSGGEPTVHPNFLKIVKAAHEIGFEYIQVNTNGIKSADLEFAQACKEA